MKNCGSFVVVVLAVVMIDQMSLISFTLGEDIPLVIMLGSLALFIDLVKGRASICGNAHGRFLWGRHCSNALACI